MTDGMSLWVPKPDASLTDLVVEKIRDAISTGALEAGQKLTEREMMERTGVSRTSVREALRHLQALGLAEPAPGRGLIVPVLDRPAIEHIYEVRGAIEPVAIRLFVLRATADEVEELARLFLAGPQVSSADGTKRALEADRMILRVVGNPLFQRTMEPLYARIQRLRFLSVTSPGRSERSRAEVEAILAAVRARNLDEAEAASRRHVEAARLSALSVLDELGGSLDGRGGTLG
ncbi:GntR family transcriptional regulator [Rhodococcus koreensis]